MTANLLRELGEVARRIAGPDVRLVLVSEADWLIIRVSNTEAWNDRRISWEMIEFSRVPDDLLRVEVETAAKALVVFGASP